ncbi:cytochrome P450 6A1 [Aaosphaeria arxii CBS 175.79]|uniref:Cytochrome P450 6A1 n=1 Tax=Aaosphaeria arxii CBS 175.79 TaxID=1450172 RepID=A0A6A5Y5M8_9PLEO|nr:cytochrome P450 6A1 [Aaosphaeria arxii CBS 175.79]KAF2019854.1 cytochrome P450 6A1 [Aaosphaeria arxii CBS 175.79]
MAVLDAIGRGTGSPTISLLVFSCVLFVIYVCYHTYQRRVPSNAPPTVKGDIPLTGVWDFWTRRWDFYKQEIDRAPTGNFSFHAGPNTLVGLSGEKGRKLFFESKELGFTQGYAVLFGSSPELKDHDDKEGIEDDTNNHFHKRITHLLKNEQFRKKLPTLKSDVQEAIEAIRNEPSGVTNPFESLYRIVFRLTIRMVGADEIAEDPQLLESCLKYFEMIDQSATAASVMFPKFPSPALLKRTYAGAQLYRMVQGLVKKRADSGEKHDDALQYMLDQGDRMFKIIEFIVGALFAGLLNSGINAAWVMCYLATSPEWLAKTREEVRRTAAKYATDPSAPLYVQLNDVPLEAWEAEFPLIDMCLRDSIRLNLLGTAFRKNISGKPIPTGHGDEVIPPDAFITYALGDIHYDPNIYPDPHKWDPARHMPDRAEDKKAPHAFLGWGVGRHPCLGMRFAKLEQNIITAYFLAAFDFTLQDEQGVTMHEAPKVNVNGHSAQKPSPRQFLKVRPLEK